MTFESIEGQLVQLPGTILSQLELGLPKNLISGIELPNYSHTERIVIVQLDNFGLLEVVLHKPQFLLKESEKLLTLETEDGFAENVSLELTRGNLQDGFHLFTHMIENGKSVVVVDRESQRTNAGTSTFTPTDSDMRTYIETAKLLNRSDLLAIHFLDFDHLYEEHTSRPPLELAQKLLHRTDRWLLGFFKQARPHTLFLILGNKGQRDYGLKYEGKYQNWVQANVPICLTIYKAPGD